jgi:hypothetical protein
MRNVRYGWITDRQFLGDGAESRHLRNQIGDLTAFLSALSKMAMLR